jgi:hypothetical protein
MPDARKYPGYAVIRVCGYNELTLLTCEGWTVLDVLEDGQLQSQLTTLPIKCVGQIHDPQNYNNLLPQEYVERVSVELPYAMTHHLFVLGLDETAAHAYLERERAAAMKALELKTAEHQAVTKANEQLLKDQAELTYKLKTADAAHETIVRERDEHRNQRYRMEQDLGKLRKAVGELQFLNLTWRCDCDHERTQHHADGCIVSNCRCKCHL